MKHERRAGHQGDAGDAGVGCLVVVYEPCTREHGERRWLVVGCIRVFIKVDVGFDAQGRGRVHLNVIACFHIAVHLRGSALESDVDSAVWVLRIVDELVFGTLIARRF